MNRAQHPGTEDLLHLTRRVRVPGPDQDDRERGPGAGLLELGPQRLSQDLAPASDTRSERHATRVRSAPYSSGVADPTNPSLPRSTIASWPVPDSAFNAPSSGSHNPPMPRAWVCDRGPGSSAT